MSSAPGQAKKSRLSYRAYYFIVAAEVLAGCYAWCMAFYLFRGEDPGATPLIVGGAALYSLGFYHWARAKSLSPQWALVGLIPLFGVLIMGRLADSPQPGLTGATGRPLGRGYGLGLFFLLGSMVAILSIPLPMYVAYKRAYYDKAVMSDLADLGKALKIFAVERATCKCDLEKIPRGIDIVEFLVGPYYLWKGTNRRCQVLIRTENEVVCACSPKASRPHGEQNRYIYRISVADGSELPPMVGPCTGKTYGGPGATCYEDSILGSDCTFRQPNGRPCRSSEYVRDQPPHVMLSKEPSCSDIGHTPPVVTRSSNSETAGFFYYHSFPMDWTMIW